MSSHPHMPIKTGIMLSETEYQDILLNQQNLSQIFTEFDKMESCGVPCDQMRAMARETYDMLERIKKAYAPPGH